MSQREPSVLPEALATLGLFVLAVGCLRACGWP